MKTHDDPLDLVRESRIKLSHECGNDPHRIVAILRKQEGKYLRQIENYKHAHACVAEKNQPHYGIEAKK